MKNNIVKGLGVGLMISLIAIPAVFGIDITRTVAVAATATGSITNLINGGCRVHMISIINGAPGAASTYEIWDSPATNGSTTATQWGLLAFTNVGYIGITQYLTNMQVFDTNSMGLTNFQVLTVGGGTMTNNPVWRSNVLWTATNTVAGSTISYRLLFRGSLASNATAVITNEFNCIYGLTITNSTSSTNSWSITYSSQL